MAATSVALLKPDKGPAAFVVTFAISFFLSPFIVRTLGVEANGLIGLSTNFLNYVRDKIEGEPLLSPVAKAVRMFAKHLERILARWRS